MSSKSGVRFGHKECVPISDGTLLRFLAWGQARFPPHQCIVRLKACAFRRAFCEAVAAAGLPEGNWKPYSIRRGAATDHFRLFGSLDATCIRGRWLNTRTCRIYVSDGISALTEVHTAADVASRLRSLQASLVLALWLSLRSENCSGP